MPDVVKKSYPLLAKATWWALRSKFKQTIPSTLTAKSLSAILDMNEVSATNNVLPALKQIHLIDQDGKVNDERARKWRDDNLYPALCEELKKELYPQELLEAVSDPIENKDAAERWFANYTGAGENAVGKMVSFYSLLWEANPEKGSESIPAPKKRKENKSQSQPSSAKPVEISAEHKVQTHIPSKVHLQPSININIQVVIPPEANTAQIDAIFASMAKHFDKQQDDRQ